MPRYFAYGSNLHVAQMLRRCPNSRVLGKAWIERTELRFFGRSRGWDGGGVATLGQEAAVPSGPDEAPRVYGALYELPDEDLHILDGFESMYRRERLVVQGVLECDAWTYLAADGHPPNEPSPRYVATMAYGYAEHELPLKALYDALNKLKG
jgi:gamma-glutamylcyclotransferase (GGCT)/AIG2-like uncharacterized protein YtfP